MRSACTLRSRLETVHLDVGLRRDAFLHNERRHLLSLIALKLDNLAQIFVVDNGTVACELLLKRLQELFLIILLGQSLECRERLSTVPLLDTDVNVVLLLLFLDDLRRFLLGLVAEIGEGIVTGEVLNIHKLGRLPVWDVQKLGLSRCREMRGGGGVSKEERGSWCVSE